MRPAKNDPSDKRCAFVLDGCKGANGKVNADEDWCHGCQFYVCEPCAMNINMPFGSHDVMAHHDEDEDDE